MAGAGDEMAAAGGYFLASHADRERVIGALRAAFAEGRLTEDELDARVARTSRSRTYAELAAITGDIPAWPGGAWAPGGAGQVLGQPPDRLPSNIKGALWGVGVLAAIPTVMFGVAVLLDSAKVAALAMVLFLADFLFAIMGGTVALGTRIDSRLKNRR